MTQPQGGPIDEYGQPEPFDPKVLPPSPQRKASNSMRRFLPAAVGLMIAVVAFAGGFAVAHATTPTTAAGPGNGDFGFGGQDGGPNGGPNASGRPRNGFGGGAAGTIGSASADQLTITTTAGGQRIVLLTPTTTVLKVTSTSQAVTDLTTGETVTIIGTSNPDGSVTATRILVGDVSLFGRGGGFGGPNGSPAPSTTP